VRSRVAPEVDRRRERGAQLGNALTVEEEVDPVNARGGDELDVHDSEDEADEERSERDHGPPAYPRGYDDSWHARCLPEEKMKNPARLIFAPLLLAGLSAAQPAAQAPRVTASAELTLFNLDVVVTNSLGDAVHGLKAADFEVRHDGKLITVTNFHEVRGMAFPSVSVEPIPPGDAPRETAPPAPSAEPRPKRRIVLFIDRLQLPDPIQRRELFDSLRRLLSESLEGNDEAMIVVWERSTQTVMPFTTSLDELEAILDRIESGSGRMPSETADIDVLRQEDAWFQSLAADPRIGSDFGGFQPTAEIYAMQAFFEMKAKTAVLKGLAATLGGMDGRKILVFVSHRFSRYAGLEFFLQDRADVSVMQDPRTQKLDTMKLLEEVTRTANANGVTLYTVFPAGMDSPTSSAADLPSKNPSIASPMLGGRERLALSNELEALDFVSARTGGVTAVGVGNLPKFVDRISADLDSWYSLGYPAPPGGGNATGVSVRVKDRKLNVRVRKTLLEKTAEEQMRDRVLAHLFQPDARARIPIKVEAKLASNTGKFRMKIEVKIPIASLVLLPNAKGVAGSFSVFVASVGPKGDFSEVTRRSQPFEIPGAELETAKTGYYTYEIEVTTSGPDARLCVGVWDEKGNEAGFAVVKPSGPG
jgi:VWFA-related protein